MANTAEGMDYTEYKRSKHIDTCALCALLALLALHTVVLLSFYHNIISYIFMWITMNAIGKSIITGRYADSFTRPAGLRRDGASECSPLGGLSVEYISLTWADVIFCAAFVLCRFYLILGF